MAEDYPVNIVFDAVDKVTAPMRRINSRIERMTGPFRRMNNRLRALGRESGIARLRESMSRVGSATGRVVGQIGSLATKLALVGGLAGTVLARTVNRVAGTGDELAKSARSMGISAEFLQEYQFAAERVGVSQSVLNTSFVAFSKRLGEMKNGYGRLRTLLKETNPELMEQLATTRSTEEAFGLLMGAMENIEDPAQRSALAAAAFSRQGVRLTNIAIAGSEEIARLRQRAHELGLVMNEDALKASERYQDSLTNMQSAMTGLQRIVGGALIPVFADLMDRMTIFFVNNREQIREWSQAFAASVPDHLRTMRDAAVSLWESLQPLIGSIQWMFDTFGTGETIVGGLALVIGGPLLASIGSLAAAIIGLGAAIGFTPIGWFLGAIAGLATAAALIYTHWDGIVSFFTGKLDAVREAFDEGLIQGVLALLREFNPVTLLIDAVTGIVEYFTGVDLAKVGRNFIDNLTVSGVLAGIDRFNPVSMLASKVNDLIEYFTGVDLNDVGRRFIGTLWDGVTAQWRAMTDWLQERMDALTGWLPDWMTGDTDRTLTIRDERRARNSPGAQGGLHGAREAVQSSTRTERRESRLQVDFRNVPRGTRIEQEGDDEDVDLSMGRAMAVP